MRKIMGALVAGTAALVLGGVAVAGSVRGQGGAPRPGTVTALTKTPAQVLGASLSRVAFCIIADGDNTDSIRFTLDATATTAIGTKLKPGDFYCDPVNAAYTYNGPVYAAAITTTATVNLYVIAY